VTSGREGDRIKSYHRRKLGTGVFSSVFVFLLLWLLPASGLSGVLAEFSRGVSDHPAGALVVFALLVGGLQTLVSLPFGFYSGYVLEHRYSLSTQTLGRWTWEHAKALAVGLPLGLGAVLLVYWTLATFGMLWWLPAGAAFALVSIILARLSPLIILPLFYRLRPLESNPLRTRIEDLCANAGLAIRDIMTFNLSKNTRKANAAFTGIGRSRRVLLGDTLLEGFTDDEITTVVAHELGHNVHRHIVRGIVTGVGLSFGTLALAALLYGWSLERMGFSGLTDLAALPLLALWIALVGSVTSPLGHLQSRHHERQADRYAVRATGNKEAFVAALRKLQVTNLADPAPHPLVEALFYSHPPMAKRIAMVESL
jgi:STE24 endopeptidase